MLRRTAAGSLACSLGGVSPSTAGAADGATDTVAATTTAVVPAPGMAHVPSPYGELHLLPAAVDAWNAMRAEALSAYGPDIYPGGPLSAYRTYGQQAELYQAFLAGSGAPANPPGTPRTSSGRRSTSRPPRCVR